MKGSFRLKFALATMLVIGGVLAAGFASFLFVSRQMIDEAFDRELVGRARRFAQPPGQGGPMGGEPGLPPVGGGGFGQGGPGPGGPGPGGSAQGGPGQGGAQGRGFDPEGDAMARIRRPRIIDQFGRVLGPTDVAEPWTPEGYEAALDKGSDLRTLVVEGRRLRIASVRTGPSGEHRVVQAAQELDGINLIFGRMGAALWWTLPVLILASGLAAWALSSIALRPVGKMRDSAETIGADDLETRLEVPADEELGGLARAFNGLLDRLASSFRRQQRVLESQRRFVADASHELRTPLARIKLTAGRAKEDADLVGAQAALARVDREADVMSRLVQQLLDLARSEGQSLALKPVDLAAAAQEAAEASVDSGPGPTVEVVPGEGTALADPTALHRALVNLIDNARRHSHSDQPVTVRVQGCVISVEDRGVGIPAEDLPRVTERFYRVDESRDRATGGSGLGLAIVGQLVQAMGGDLKISSQEGRGTTVEIRLQPAFE